MHMKMALTFRYDGQNFLSEYFLENKRDVQHVIGYTVEQSADGHYYMIKYVKL